MNIITQEVVRELHAKLQKTLDAFAAEHGFKASVAPGTYTLHNVQFKAEFAVVGAEGTALTREAEHFFYFAASFGLTPQYLGKSFIDDGKNMKIIGLKPGNRSYPIMVVDDADRRYKYTIERIKDLVKM